MLKFKIISHFHFKHNSFTALFTYIFIEALPATMSYFLKYIQNNCEYLSDTGYDPSGNSNSSFHIGVDILNLLFCMTFLYFSIYSKCQDFMKQHIYPFFLSLFYLKD